MKKNAVKDSPEDFDFFITTGDNMYPNKAKKPTKAEFEKIASLFNERDAIKNVPIYSVRGNHDCYFNNDLAEL
jgi:metallophosphoesterase superfamily enzyme